MADDPRSRAIERLRDATINREALLSHIYNDTRGVDDMEPGVSSEDYLRAQNDLLQTIEDGALRIAGEVYHARDDAEPDERYAEARGVIEQASAGWLYPVILDRALNAVGGDA